MGQQKGPSGKPGAASASRNASAEDGGALPGAVSIPERPDQPAPAPAPVPAPAGGGRSPRPARPLRPPPGAAAPLPAVPGGLLPPGGA